MNSDDNGNTTITVSSDDQWSPLKIVLVIAMILLAGAPAAWDALHHPGESQSAATAAATPQSQFAAFTLTDSEGGGAPQAVVFQDGKIEIVRVGSAREIPAEEREAAQVVRPGDGGAVPRIAAGGIYIFHGQIDVNVAGLDGYDSWKATFQTRGGDVDRVVSEVSTASPRGPPQTRKIYVVGTIGKYTGPQLHDYSFAQAAVLNLSQARSVPPARAAARTPKREIDESETEDLVRKRMAEHPVEEHPIQRPRPIRVR